MSQYSDDVDMDVGTAARGLPLSANAVHYQIFSQTSDAGSESEGSQDAYGQGGGVEQVLSGDSFPHIREKLF